MKLLRELTVGGLVGVAIIHLLQTFDRMANATEWQWWQYFSSSLFIVWIAFCIIGALLTLKKKD